MEYTRITMAPRKCIALVAHDNKKQDLFDWAKFNRELLAEHKLFATGTTGAVLEQRLGLKIEKLESGPLGGDQQIGAEISRGKDDALSSSGIPWKLYPTIRISKPYCELPSFGTFRWPAIARLRTFSSPRRSCPVNISAWFATIPVTVPDWKTSPVMPRTRKNPPGPKPAPPFRL